MKLLLALALLSMSTISFAKRPVTLGDYDASMSHIVMWPSVVFSNLSIPVKNVCVDGDLLKTIAPEKFCSVPGVVQVCNVYNNGSENCRPVKAGETPKETANTRLVWGCLAYDSRDFETTRSYQASVCTKWVVDTRDHDGVSYKCTEYGFVTKEYPLSYDVSVISTQSHDSGNEEVAKIGFDLPACK